VKKPSAVSHQPSAKCRFLPFGMLRVGMTVLIGALTIAAQDKPVALKGGKLLTITHGVIENGVLVMQGGKITAVGAEGSVSVPGGAQIIDVSGMTIYPGLIDSETQLGLTEISAEAMTNDLVEMRSCRTCTRQRRFMQNLR